MPLNPDVPAEAEVVKIISGMGSDEARHYLCSAVLYYARSPLVLSSNALVDVLKGADERFGEVLRKLDSFRGDLVNSSNQTCNTGDSTVYEGSAVPVSGKVDDSTRGALSSLKQKFKV
jgi:hypothetical protein